jgi:hypothetical protein
MKGWDLLGGFVCAAVACGGDTVHLGATSHEAGSGSDNAGSGAEGDGGATSIASLIQLTPTNLVSDGTTLFWTSSVGSGGAVSSMPVYYPGPSGGIARAPKGGGGTPTLVSEAGASVGGVTALGASAYWTEEGPGPTGAVGAATDGATVVKSAPLLGGAVATIAVLNSSAPGMVGYGIGVTTTTVFLSSGIALTSFPLSSGVPDGGMPAQVPGATQGCQSLSSDTDAVYCDTDSSLYRVASDGTTTLLGTVVEEGQTGDAVAFDDTYVYWLDIDTVGTIMKVPKTGGTAAIIARDTSPVAIAVDANAVYWSDAGGFIMRLAK